MSSCVKVKNLPSRSPHATPQKDHHTGNTFDNPWPSKKKIGLGAALSARFGSNPERNYAPVPEGPNGTRSQELVNIRKPTWGAKEPDRMRATWIGHASWMLETPTLPGAERGIRILCDPVFSERTSFSQWIGPKRYSPTPCTLEELPEVDVVLISHDHYDHLDLATVQHIYNKQKDRVHFLAGLNNAKWFVANVGCQPHEATDADWWDSFEVTVEDLGSVTLTCCPAQHASGRNALHMNSTLWCSWAISTQEKSVYFAGDTAYQAEGTSSPCPAFSEIGEALGPFDLALLPIGLMTPHSFMGGVHATPEQSIGIHKEIRARTSLGMHYGTVRGGISAQYEDVREPPRRWRVAAQKAGLWRGGGVEGDGSPVDLSEAGVGLCGESLQRGDRHNANKSRLQILGRLLLCDDLLLPNSYQFYLLSLHPVWNYTTLLSPRSSGRRVADALHPALLAQPTSPRHLVAAALYL